MNAFGAPGTGAGPLLTALAGTNARLDFTRAQVSGTHMIADAGLTGVTPLAGTENEALTEARAELIRAAMLAHLVSVGSITTYGAHLLSDDDEHATLAAIPACDGTLGKLITLVLGLHAVDAAHDVSPGTHFHDDLLGVGGTITTNPPTTLSHCRTDLNDILASMQAHFLLAIGSRPVLNVPTISFVFRPGDVTMHDNVYTTWAPLAAAVAAVEGKKIIVFDDALGACVVPAGTWNMADAVWEGVMYRPVAVTIADGAVLQQLHRIDSNLIITSQSSTSPVVDITDGDVILLERGSTIQCAAGKAPFFDLSTIGDNHGVVFVLRDGAGLINDGAPVLKIPALAQADVFVIGSFSVLDSSTVTGPAGAVLVIASNTGGSTVFGTASTSQPGFGGTLQFLTSLGRIGISALFSGPGSITPDFGIVLRCDPTGGAINVNMPAAANSSGQIVVVKNESDSANAINIVPNGGDTIDAGNVNATPLAQARGALWFASDGVSNWILIARPAFTTKAYVDAGDAAAVASAAADTDTDVAEAVATAAADATAKANAAKTVQGYAEVGTNDVSTGTGYQTLLTVVVNGAGKLWVWAQAVPSSTSFNNWVYFQIKVDGAVKSTNAIKVYCNSGLATIPAILAIPIQTVGAGDHTVLLEWKDSYDAGTAHVKGSSDANEEQAFVYATITP